MISVIKQKWVVESTNLHFGHWYIFVSFRNKVDIIVHYDDISFWVSADANKETLNAR